jgi:hypothetical protein
LGTVVQRLPQWRGSEVNMESIPLSQAKELAPDRDVAIGDILYFDKGLLGMASFVCGVGDTVSVIRVFETASSAD